MVVLPHAERVQEEISDPWKRSNNGQKARRRVAEDVQVLICVSSESKLGLENGCYWNERLGGLILSFLGILRSVRPPENTR
jgi:hypothetical protein